MDHQGGVLHLLDHDHLSEEALAFSQEVSEVEVDSEDVVDLIGAGEEALEIKGPQEGEHGAEEWVPFGEECLPTCLPGEEPRQQEE